MYSLGEIESQCKKAAKGIGFSWGMAEEFGLIARHLSEVGLPGADSVYTNLKFIESCGVECALKDIELFEKIKRPLAGAFLAINFVDKLSESLNYELKISNSIVGPLALVGMFLRLQKEQYYFLIEWTNCSISLNEFGFKVSGKNQNPEVVNDLKLNVRKSEESPLIGPVCRSRLVIYNWNGLAEMANRTYVPSSEFSRLRGAGAGEAENE
jgi:hypothetical protein